MIRHYIIKIISEGITVGAVRRDGNDFFVVDKADGGGSVWEGDVDVIICDSDFMLLKVC